MRLTAKFATIFCLTVAGCASYTLIDAKPVVVAKGGYVVTPVSLWNKAPIANDLHKNGERWTKDGPALNQIIFYSNIVDGDQLFKTSKRAPQQPPKFRSTMLPQELPEYLESNYRSIAGLASFETTSVTPQQFLNAPGVKFDFSYISNDDLRHKGRAVATIIDKKLHLAIYDASAVHYYEQDLAEFDRIVTTAQIRS